MSVSHKWKVTSYILLAGGGGETSPEYMKDAGNRQNLDATCSDNGARNPWVTNAVCPVVRYRFSYATNTTKKNKPTSAAVMPIRLWILFQYPDTHEG
jgi:hypothetical protein